MQCNEHSSAFVFTMTYKCRRAFFVSIFDRYRNQDTAGIWTGLGSSCIIQDSLAYAVHLLVLNHSTDLGH